MITRFLNIVLLFIAISNMTMFAFDGCENTNQFLLSAILMGIVNLRRNEQS